MNIPIETKISRLTLPPEAKNQLKCILATDIVYVPHPDFHRPSRMNQILNKKIHLETNVWPDREQEMILFLQLNYFRYKRGMIRRSLLRQEEWPMPRLLELIQYDNKQQEHKDKLITCNIGLVIAMAQRIRVNGLDYEDLVSEGNIALVMAVDRFDCSYGYRFSTYACRPILTRMSRLAKAHYRFANRYFVSWEPSLEKDNHLQQQRQEYLNERAWAISEIVRANRAELTETELSVLEKRFSLGKKRFEPVTLETIGRQLNLSKERIRQIQNIALEKVRQASKRDFIAV